MELRHDHSDFKLCLSIAKLALKAASVTAAFCLVKEVHKVHKAIEHKHHND